MDQISDGEAIWFSYVFLLFSLGNLIHNMAQRKKASNNSQDVRQPAKSDLKRFKTLKSLCNDKMYNKEYTE